MARREAISMCASSKEAHDLRAHDGGDLKRNLVRRIINQANLSEDEFQQLL
jgi:hypothetical protein